MEHQVLRYLLKFNFKPSKTPVHSVPEFFCTITGEKVKYENDTYLLTNGYSAKLTLNFDKFTTFKETTFTSSNEYVIKINKDGTITPNNIGKATLTVSINDNMLPEVKLEINVEVIQKDFISNLEDFLGFIRKGLGHFGAFLVFGVLTALTYMFFFKKTLVTDSIITISNGIALSAITETIQLLVPGRVGNINDVLLDFVGFIVGALIIFVILLIKKQITFNKDEHDLS